MSIFKKTVQKIFHFSLLILLLFYLTGGVILAQINPQDPEISNPNTEECNPTVENCNEDIPGPINTLPNTGTPPTSSETIETYTLLQPLDGFPETFNTADDCAFGKYLNLMIDIFIGIAAVLAMVMIVMGGIEYMTSELISSKEEGKKRITHAILGLLLALGAWLILHEINPNLLNLCLDKLPTAQIQVGPAPEGTSEYTPISAESLEAFESLEALGVDCPGSGGVGALAGIANSFLGKVTYSQANRGTINNGTIYLDCSSFVKQVYACAGINLPGYNTNTMFSGQEVVNSITGNTVNGTPLQVGDMLGWTAGQNPNSQYGHIVMYIGNGMFIEVGGGGGPNGAARIRSLNHYSGNYHYILRSQFI